MNVVDSSGWLEYFADGENTDFFASAIEDAESLVVPSICVYEVFKRVHQQRGENSALQAIAQLHQGLIVELTASLALQAAQLSLESGLPMADSVILATARTYQANLWTQDAHFDGLDGVRYVLKQY